MKKESRAYSVGNEKVTVVIVCHDPTIGEYGAHAQALRILKGNY